MPAATFFAWSGLGFQRGSPKLCSMNDLATSKPTSIPTRSINSNGPMRKPPPSRTMRSICSWVATRSWSSLSASAPNGRLQRFTRNPGPSCARITRLPICSATWVATEIARSPDCSAAITSTSCITGGGLKKCIPTTFSGRAAAFASEVTRIEEVFVASTRSGFRADSSAKSSRLRSGRSGTASITSSHAASAPRSSATRSSAGSPENFSSRLRTFCAPRASASGIGS